PRLACAQGRMSAAGAPTGRIAMSAAAAYDSSSDELSFNGSALRVAATDLRFSGQVHSGLWSLEVEGDRLDLDAARRLAQPWFSLPAGDSLGGHLQLKLLSGGRLDRANPPRPLQARLTPTTAD